MDKRTEDEQALRDIAGRREAAAAKRGEPVPKRTGEAIRWYVFNTLLTVILLGAAAFLILRSPFYFAAVVGLVIGIFGLYLGFALVTGKGGRNHLSW